MSPDPAWVALSLVEHMGMTRLRALLEAFDGSPGAILAADERALRRVPGIGAVIAAAIRAINLCEVEDRIKVWEADGLRLLTHPEDAYPAALRDLPDAPPTLFVRGQLDWMTLPATAVVGTRHPSPAGKNAARKIGYALAQQGYAVISGLALGIDAEAHSGALIAEGTTAAVLGGGIRQIYPVENQKLAGMILRVRRGALLSETEPDANPSASRLVARNRIIAALAQQVIVVESDDDGGAMHAARRALELGRAVCTLDLPASGNRELMALGARVISPDQIDEIAFGDI